MTSWTLEQAQDHLLSLELFGMRFGVERMHRLLEGLGAPQQRLRAIHVVGTNGKSSVTRMAAALLEAHGLRAGAYVSPHLETFTERIRIGGSDLAPTDFAAAIQRAAQAAARIEAAAPDDERVTQFELLTAAALDELARQGVDVAVIEAGLGGRLDATNVLQAPVVVLTSVGLDHTQHLGDTEAAIAAEKVAVLAPEATLVCGPLADEALEVAERAAAERGARMVLVPGGVARGAMALPGYQRDNFAIASAAVEALIGPLDPGAVSRAAAAGAVPGRLQVLGEAPLILFDGAHNAAGVRTLTQALDEVVGDRPLVAVISILGDKDPGEMLVELLPRCVAGVLTQAANPRALPVPELLARAPRGDWELHARKQPGEALQLARQLAGPDGAVLVTGSLHLIGDLLSDPRHRVVSAQ